MWPPMPAKTWAEYHATQDTKTTVDVQCDNTECEYTGVTVPNVDYTSEYPQIFCGACGAQVLRIYRDKKWETIEDKDTYFGRLK